MHMYVLEVHDNDTRSRPLDVMWDFFDADSVTVFDASHDNPTPREGRPCEKCDYMGGLIVFRDAKERLRYGIFQIWRESATRYTIHLVTDSKTDFDEFDKVLGTGVKVLEEEL